MPTVATAPLTLEQFLATLPTDVTKSPKALTKHSLVGKGISGLPVSGLAFFSGLRMLDLSDNHLTDISPLANMLALRHLVLKSNSISDLSPLSTVAATLVVLDVSSQNGALTSLRSLFAPFTATSSKNKATAAAEEQRRARRGGIIFPDLKTIIAASNPSLTSVGFNDGALPSLDTLVLSRCSHLGGASSSPEAQQELFDSIATVADTLRKCSLSMCGITELPSDLELPRLHELRLAKNPDLAAIPTSIRLKQLQILDLSSCAFQSLDSISRFPFLQHLAVSGNPAKLANPPNAALEKRRLAFCHIFFTDLKTLDGKKFDHEQAEALGARFLKSVKLRVKMRRQGQIVEDEGEADDEDDDYAAAAAAAGEPYDATGELGHQQRRAKLPLRRQRDTTDAADAGDADDGIDAEEFIKRSGAQAAQASGSAAATKAIQNVKRRGKTSADGVFAGEEAAEYLVQAAHRRVEQW